MANAGPLWQTPLILLVVIAAAAWVAFHFRRANTLLQRWAAASGYRILDRQWRLLRRGPFFLTTSGGQEVYRVIVEDSAGNIRKAYVRCGGYFLGMLSNRVDVRWDANPGGPPGFPVIMPDHSPDERWQ